MLKLYRWWNSHFVSMIAGVYYVLSLSASPPSVVTFVTAVALFTLASIGIASFGQLLNDVTDVHQDTRTGSHNLVASMRPMQVMLLFVAVLILGITPWLWLPTSPAIVALLLVEYLLFFLYSVPPLRWKGRGLLGPIADSIYAYVVPQLVALSVFSRIGNVSLSVPFLCAISTWCFSFGLQQIIEHQLRDESRDRADGIQTFVVGNGWGRSLGFALNVVAWTEAAALLAVVMIEGASNPLVPAGFALHVFCVLWAWRHRGHWHTAHFQSLPRIDRLLLLSRLIIARFQWLWHPLLLLVGLVARSPDYLVVAGMHFLVFPAEIMAFVRLTLPEWWRLSRAARGACNLHA